MQCFRINLISTGLIRIRVANSICGHPLRGLKMLRGITVLKFYRSSFPIARNGLGLWSWRQQTFTSRNFRQFRDARDEERPTNATYFRQLLLFYYDNWEEGGNNPSSAKKASSQTIICTWLYHQENNRNKIRRLLRSQWRYVRTAEMNGNSDTGSTQATTNGCTHNAINLQRNKRQTSSAFEYHGWRHCSSEQNCG